MRKLQRFVALAALLAVAGACDDDGGTAPAEPAEVAAVTPAAQAGTAGAAAAAPAVRVADRRGRPLAGVPVTFAVAAGGGSVAQASVATDANGVAAAGSWTLGGRAGENVVTATVAGLPPVTFTAAAAPAAAAALAAAGGDRQTAPVGTALADELAVRATDAFGNPVAGVSVAFAVASGAGVLGAPAAVTGADGVARARLTLGREPGPVAVTATAAGLPALTFTVTAAAGAPASLVKVAGDNQEAEVGTALADSLAVRAADAFGNPVAGVAVNFTVAPGGGGWGVAPSTVTDTSGVARVRVTAGTRPGAVTITAQAAGVAPVTFAATALASAAPAAIARAGGDRQSGTVGRPLADELAVRATDRFGNPVAGATIRFAVQSGEGTLSAASATTGADGVARVRLTLGRRPGTVTVAASHEGLPGELVFTAEAEAGPPAALVAHAGDDQSAPAGGAVAVAPAVRVTDALGNGLEGVPVSFAVASGGGRVTGGNAVTNAQGVAAVGSWTLGAAGANTLRASAGSFPAVTFSATAQDPCATSAAYTPGSTVTGELGPQDCVLPGGQRIDFHSFSTSAPQALTLDLAAGGDAFLYLFDALGRAVAADDDGGPGTDARIRVIAPAGSYFIGASRNATSTSGPTLPGAYTLSSATGSADAAGCEQVWMLAGITTSQQLATADTCHPRDYADRFHIELRAGQTVTIRQTSTAFDTFLTLYDGSGGVVAANDDSDGTLNSRITFTAPVAGRYTIEASSFSSLATGAYTLSIQ